MQRCPTPSSIFIKEYLNILTMTTKKKARTTLREAPVRYTEDPKRYLKWYYENVTKKAKK